MKKCEQITGMEQTRSKVNASTAKRANQLGKIPDPSMIDGKNNKWKEIITFNQYVQKVDKWLGYQGSELAEEEALDSANF